MSKTPPEATAPKPSSNLGSNEKGCSTLSNALGSRERSGGLPQSVELTTAPADLGKFHIALITPGMVVFLGIHALLALVFFIAPEIDLGFSRLFYTPGEGFVLGTRSSNKALPFLPWLTIGFVSLSILLLIRNLVAWWRNRLSTSQRLSTRRILFLLLTLAVGPGLLINLILKQHSGRARPYRVQAFGGDRQFTSAIAPTAQCKGNCSFVSGDAAIGYYLLTFMFIARKRRWVIALSGYALGTAIGLVRISQGAHFLSDIIFAGFFTFLVAWILHLLILCPEEDSSEALHPGAADLNSRVRS